jgi:hypothetical protein
VVVERFQPLFFFVLKSKRSSNSLLVLCFPAGDMRHGVRDGRGELTITSTAATLTSATSSDRDDKGSDRGSARGSGEARSFPAAGTRVVRYKGAFKNGVFHGRGVLTTTVTSLSSAAAAAAASARLSRQGTALFGGSRPNIASQGGGFRGGGGPSVGEARVDEVRELLQRYSGDFSNGVFHGSGREVTQSR